MFYYVTEFIKDWKTYKRGFIPSEFNNKWSIGVLKYSIFYSAFINSK